MKKGFTLIELTIVILIMGILTTMAVPTYKRMILKSRSSMEAGGIISSIVNAQERYKIENGVFYPNNDSTIKNESSIVKELKIKLSTSNNFNYFIEDLSGVDDGNFTIKVMLRADSWDSCTNSTPSTLCKQSGAIDEDDWVKQYNRAEDKHYLEFRYPNKLTGDFVEGGVSYEHLNDN